MKRFKANEASLMSDFHRASLEMALLRLCRITNGSTETENYYSSLNRELRWLWNSVYLVHCTIVRYNCSARVAVNLSLDNQIYFRINGGLHRLRSEITRR